MITQTRFKSMWVLLLPPAIWTEHNHLSFNLFFFNLEKTHCSFHCKGVGHQVPKHLTLWPLLTYLVGKDSTWACSSSRSSSSSGFCFSAFLSRNQVYVYSSLAKDISFNCRSKGCQSQNWWEIWVAVYFWGFQFVPICLSSLFPNSLLVFLPYCWSYQSPGISLLPPQSKLFFIDFFTSSHKWIRPNFLTHFFPSADFTFHLFFLFSFLRWSGKVFIWAHS